MLPLKEFYSINEDEKGSLYADRMIRFIRMNMQPLVNRSQALTGLDYLLGQQSMTTTEDLFQDPSQINLNNTPRNAFGIVDQYGKNASSHNNTNNTVRNDMKGVEFKSLPILMKAFRIISAEMKKMGVVTNVRANDPTSASKRHNDEVLVKKRKELEAMLSYVYTSIGEQPVNFSEYKDRFKEKHDNGNTADFEKMGLSGDDVDDVAFFFSNFYKLDWEIEMQTAIDAIISFNEIAQNNIPRWVTDGMAKNAGALQVYVSDDNGAIVVDYLTPETVYIYGSGRRQDYNDAMAKCYEQSVTIKQFLDRVGSAFDFDKDLDHLTLAVFYASSGSIDITGINPAYGGVGWSGGSDDWYCKARNGTNYSHNEFMNFKVVLGYMEWTSQNYTEYGESLKGKNKEFDNKKKEQEVDAKNSLTEDTDSSDGTPTADNQPPSGKKYDTKARYECPTYKSYYLALSSFQHLKFKFGKATYQDIKGYNDFNSNFSIITWKEIGDPLAVMAIPMIDIINEAFYKWRWILRKSKAPGTDYNVESLVKIADEIFCDTDGRENRIQKTMQWMDASSNRLWAFPEIDGKPVILTNNQLNIEVENGLKEGFMKYWETMTVTWDKLIDMLIGQSDLRQGESTGPRSSVNNEFKALEYSQNTTSFLADMITFFCRQAAQKTSLFIQDIVTYKDYDTLAYKFLTDIVGDQSLEIIEEMGKTAMHRYGVNIESLNQAPRLAKLSQRIDFAIQNGKLSNAQALLIEDIKSPTLAFKTLAYFEQRNDKVKQKQAMELQQAQAKQAQAQAQQIQDLEKIKGDYMIAGKQIDAKSNLDAHATTQVGGLLKTSMKQQGDINQATHEAILALQQEVGALKPSLPPVAPPPLPTGNQGPPPGGPQQQPGAQPPSLAQFPSQPQQQA
jgi:hypothetical protein